MIRDQLDVTKHPVPVTLTEDDIISIFEGRFISKVYYLEDPQQANTAPTQPGEPFEIRAASEEEAIKEARQKGRLVLILRPANGDSCRRNWREGNVPGTILFASAKRMPVPALPPCLPYGNIPLYDPLLGPKIPEEECFHDGGDQKRRSASAMAANPTGLMLRILRSSSRPSRAGKLRPPIASAFAFRVSPH